MSVAEEILSFEFRNSRRLTWAMVAAHAATAIVLAATLPWSWWLACAWLLLAANAGWLMRRSENTAAVSGFELAADCGCRWQQAELNVEGRLRTDTLALPWLIVLRFDLAKPRGVRSIILFPGALHADDWRRLQVFLKWGVRFNAAGPIPSGAPY